MEITNAVIIYFTLGVPFGILSVYLRKARFEPVDVFRVIYNLTFWPLILLTRSIGAGEFVRREPTTSVRNSNRNSDRKARAQQMIRDGLNTAYEAALAADKLELPFAEAIQHPNPELAAKCFHRRNVRLLEHHAVQAQIRFPKMLEELGEARGVGDPDGPPLEANDPRTVLS